MRVDNDDLILALKCAEQVNRAGIDSVTATECISWVQELYQRGLLTARDCDGLDLSWGNSLAVYGLLQKIIRNEGFGAVLSQGVVKAAETLGVGRDLCMEGKNLEMFMADVRGLKACGLANAVASRGADHQRADPMFEMSERTEEAREHFGSENCALQRPWQGKGKMVPWFEEICALADSMSFCKIIGVSMEAVLARWGLARKDDYLPRRFREEPLPADSGPAAGLVFENEELLDEYYRFRGWDPATGWPTRRKLEELGLRFVADDLEARGIELAPDYASFTEVRPGEDPTLASTTARWAYLAAKFGESRSYMDSFRPPADTGPLRRGRTLMKRRLLVDPTLCSGCRACEIGCSFAHEGEYSSALARLHVVKLEESGVDRPIVCLRCAKAPCAAVCPENAIRQDSESKIVSVDGELCVGCGLCVEACVSGVIQLHPRTSVPLLCDLCGGDPECVKRCPTGALVAVEGRDHAGKGTREAAGRRTAQQLGKLWNSPEAKRPVDRLMIPPDPETGSPIEPPKVYGGSPPPPLEGRIDFGQEV